MKITSRLVLSGLCLVFASKLNAADSTPTIEWIRQIGTSGNDRGQSVTTDGAGGVYLAGYANGNVGGSYAGNDDIVVRKFDSAGTVQWTRQLGTSSNDTPESISHDGIGNLYVAGTTSGNLAVGAAGNRDPFVLKYDTSGTLLWSRQFGTSSTELGLDVFADANNVYISGFTEGFMGSGNMAGGDAFVSKFDNEGTLLWSRQYGSNQIDFGNGVAADAAGNVYVAGRTNIYSGQTIVDGDAFLIKYDSAGNLVWTRSIQPSRDLGANDLVVQGNDVYVVGNVLKNGGDWDSFITRYNTNGILQSYTEWGSSTGSLPYDLAADVVIDPLGGVLVAGTTRISLDGPNLGGQDSFVTKFDANGTLAWTKQFGTSSSDEANGIATDSAGKIYVAGATTNALTGN